MDTRSKILSIAQALELRMPIKAVLAYFDPLLAAHVRRLNELASPEMQLMAIVLDSPAPILDLRARAELAAGLGIIDFVVPVEGDPAPFLQRLAPREVVHEELQDARRTAQLIEHVQQRYQS